MTKMYSDRENESDSQARFFLDQALFYDPGRMFTRVRMPTIGKHASRTGTKLLEQYNTQ